MRAGEIISFYIKNGKFGNYFKKHLIKIYQNASIFKIFSEELNCPRTPLPCTACSVATCIYTVHFWKNYLHTSVKSCNVCALSFFGKKQDKKGPLFPIFKRSTSIHKNNPA